MKYYKSSENKIYANPGDIKIESLGLTEIETPCFNGIRLPNHELAANVELDDEGNYYSNYNDDGSVNSEAEATYTDQIKAKTEYEWAASALADTDVQVAYHNRASSRAVATIEAWYEYQEALCDYCSKSEDEEGNITYLVRDISEQYSVGDDGRPVAPTAETVEASA